MMEARRKRKAHAASDSSDVHGGGKGGDEKRSRAKKSKKKDKKTKKKRRKALTPTPGSGRSTPHSEASAPVSLDVLPPTPRTKVKRKTSPRPRPISSFSNFVQRLNQLSQQGRCGPLTYEAHRTTDNAGHTFFRCVVVVGPLPATLRASFHADELGGRHERRFHVARFASDSTFTKKKKAKESAARQALLGLGFARDDSSSPSVQSASASADVGSAILVPSVSVRGPESQPPSTNSKNWDVLPKKLLLGIATFLDASSNRNFALTCEAFYAVMVDRERFNPSAARLQEFRDERLKLPKPTPVRVTHPGQTAVSQANRVRDIPANVVAAIAQRLATSRTRGLTKTPHTGELHVHHAPDCLLYLNEPSIHPGLLEAHVAIEWLQMQNRTLPQPQPTRRPYKVVHVFAQTGLVNPTFLFYRQLMAEHSHDQPQQAGSPHLRAYPAFRVARLTNNTGSRFLGRPNHILRRLSDDDVVLTTGQFLLNCLRHGFLRLTSKTLLIFHQCHLASKKHPFSLIAAEFLRPQHRCTFHERVVAASDGKVLDSLRPDIINVPSMWDDVRPVVFGSTCLPSQHRQVPASSDLRLFVNGLQVNLAAEFVTIADFLGVSSRTLSVARDPAPESMPDALATDKRSHPLREVVLKVGLSSEVERHSQQMMHRLLDLVRSKTSIWETLAKSPTQAQARSSSALQSEARGSGAAPEWTSRLEAWHQELENIDFINSRYGPFCAAFALSQSVQQLPRHPFSGTRPELSRAYEDLLRVCLAQSTHCSRPMPSSLQPNPSHQELQEAQLVHFAEALLLAGVSGAGALSPWAKAILNQVWTLLNDGDPSSSSLEPGPQAIVFLEQRFLLHPVSHLLTSFAAFKQNRDILRVSICQGSRKRKARALLAHRATTTQSEQAKVLARFRRANKSQGDPNVLLTSAIPDEEAFGLHCDLILHPVSTHLSNFLTPTRTLAAAAQARLVWLVKSDEPVPPALVPVAEKRSPPHSADIKTNRPSMPRQGPQADHIHTLLRDARAFFDRACGWRQGGLYGHGKVNYLFCHACDAQFLPHDFGGFARHLQLGSHKHNRAKTPILSGPLFCPKQCNKISSSSRDAPTKVLSSREDLSENAIECISRLQQAFHVPATGAAATIDSAISLITALGQRAVNNFLAEKQLTSHAQGSGGGAVGPLLAQKPKRVRREDAAPKLKTTVVLGTEPDGSKKHLYSTTVALPRALVHPNAIKYARNATTEHVLYVTNAPTAQSKQQSQQIAALKALQQLYESGIVDDNLLLSADVSMHSDKRVPVTQDAEGPPAETGGEKSQAESSSVVCLKPMFPASHWPKYVQAFAARFKSSGLFVTSQSLGNLFRAFTHASSQCVLDAGGNETYEVLEVLGDSVLKFLSTLTIFSKHPDAGEGFMSSLRMRFINNQYLFRCGVAAGLPSLVRFRHFNHVAPGSRAQAAPGSPRINLSGNLQRGNSTESADPRPSASELDVPAKVIADVVEAIVGAAFLDGGLRGAAALLKYLEVVDCTAELANMPTAHASSMLGAEHPALSTGEAFTVGGHPANKRPRVAHAAMTPRQRELFVQIGPVEAKLGYLFKNKDVLMRAVMHSSKANELRCASNERLEFLGDAALDLLVVDFIFRQSLANIAAGQTAIRCLGLVAASTPRAITQLKAAVVCNPAYAFLACRMGLGSTLLHSHSAVVHDQLERYDQWAQSVAVTEAIRTAGAAPDGPEAAGIPPAPKLFSDLFEAVAAAVLLDGGYREFERVFSPLVGEFIKEVWRKQTEPQ